VARNWKFGIISRSAIRAFMDRQRDDNGRMMLLSEDALQIRMREDLPRKPPVWYQLLRQQRAMVYLLALYKRFAFFMDTGTGKTYGSVAAMRYFQETDEARRFLVLVPNVSNKYEWAAQITEHCPRMVYEVLEGTIEDRWKQIGEAQADVYIETYSGLMHLMCNRTKDKRKNKSGRRRMEPNATKVEKLQKFFEGVCCDESTWLKEKDALPYRCVRRLANTARVFWIMTGTPMGRDPMDLWAQMHLVDDGESLGETAGLFRQAFFDWKEDYWAVRKWTFKKDYGDILNEFLAHRSVTLEANAADKPHLITARKYVDLPKDAVEYYEQALDAMKAARGDFVEQKNAFIRARQISSGFVGFTGEDDERMHHTFSAQPKLDALEDYIRDYIADGDKFIIFHEFKQSGRMICDMLKRNGIKYRLLNGDESKHSASIKEDFNNDPDTTCLVLNNAAGAYGLNLQLAKYGLVYEAPVSAIIRKQTVARFHRQYSKHERVYLVDFVTRATADETILTYHAQGRALWRAILKVRASEEDKLAA
jgi:SNF2 family DNA or RNA helicase